MEREIGSLQARMQAVETELQAIRVDVREIRDALVTARSAWGVLTVIISLSVSLGTLIGKFIPQYFSLTH